MPTLLRLYRLACRPCRAAETCIPGNHGIRRRYRKTRNRSRRGTRSHPPPRAFISSRPGHGSRGFVQRAYFLDPCTGMHKRRIPAVAEIPHTHNKSLLLRRNWLRFANPRATRPNLCASETPLARNQTVPPKTHIRRPNREFVFSLHPRSAPPAPPHQFAWIRSQCLPRSVHRNAQTQNRCHLPLPG